MLHVPAPRDHLCLVASKCSNNTRATGQAGIHGSSVSGRVFLFLEAHTSFPRVPGSSFSSCTFNADRSSFGTWKVVVSVPSTMFPCRVASSFVSSSIPPAQVAPFLPNKPRRATQCHAASRLARPFEMQQRSRCGCAPRTRMQHAGLVHRPKSCDV